MEFGIVGIKSLIGQRSKKSGKELNAYILHLVRDNPRDEGLQGHEVRQQFVDASLMAEDIKKLGGYSMLVGARIDLSYDEGVLWILSVFCPTFPPTSERLPAR